MMYKYVHRVKEMGGGNEKPYVSFPFLFFFLFVPPGTRLLLFQHLFTPPHIPFHAAVKIITILHPPPFPESQKNKCFWKRFFFLPLKGLRIETFPDSPFPFPLKQSMHESLCLPWDKTCGKSRSIAVSGSNNPLLHFRTPV